MFFDTEQWGIIGDDTPAVLLGLVSNTLLVVPEVGRAYSVCIRVPSGFFSFLKEVLSLEKDDSGMIVSFYLEEVGADWYLGISFSTQKHAQDLWRYRGLPAWASPSRCLPR